VTGRSLLSADLSLGQRDRFFALGPPLGHHPRKPYADFVEKDQRYQHKSHAQRVLTGREDHGHHGLDHDRVPAHLAHALVADQAGPGQQQHDHGQLEDHAEGQHEGDHESDIAFGLEELVEGLAAIADQELEPHRQHHEIGEDHSAEKEDGGGGCVGKDAPLFALVKSGHHEGPKLVEHKGQGDY
jgi:hypothetical protein